MALLLRKPKRKLQQRPKLERAKKLPISDEAVNNIKQYRKDLESLDRQVLTIQVQKHNIDSAMLLFETTDKKDVSNDRIMTQNLWSFSFIQKPVDYSKSKFRYTWVTLGKLNHSFLDSQVLKDCIYNKETNTWAGYGDVEFYTRRAGTKSIGFTKANPIKELRTKLMYFNFMSDNRRLNLQSLVCFGLTILEEFNQVYKANDQLFHLYVNPHLIMGFFDRFEKAEFHLQDSLWNSVKPKHIGRRCSILGFSKHK